MVKHNSKHQQRQQFKNGWRRGLSTGCTELSTARVRSTGVLSFSVLGASELQAMYVNMGVCRMYECMQEHTRS
jgi:hypothetical protein